MSILLFAFIVILVLALVVWLIDTAPFEVRIKWALKAIAVIAAILVILSRSGLVRGVA